MWISLYFVGFRWISCAYVVGFRRISLDVVGHRLDIVGYRWIYRWIPLATVGYRVISLDTVGYRMDTRGWVGRHAKGIRSVLDGDAT